MNNKKLSIFSFYFLILLLLMFGLNGCAVINNGMNKTDPLPPGKGMVAIHICNALAENKNWTSIELWSDTDKKVYTLNRNNDSEVHQNLYQTTNHFSGALPPGDYQIDALKSEEVVASGRYISTAPLHDKLGRFKVESGKLTDLGTVVFYPQYWSMGIGLFSVFAIGGKDTAPVLKQLNPVAYSAISKVPSLGWQQIFAAKAPQQISLVTNNLPRVNPFFEAENGELYAGGLLGKIFHRKNNGTWETLDTGSNFEIFKIEKVAATIYATSENNVFKSSDEGKSWETISLPKLAGRLEFFHKSKNGTEYVYLLTKSTLFKTFNLYQRNTDSEEWKQITSDSYDIGLIENILPSMYQVSETPRLQFTPGNNNNYMLSQDGKSITRDLVALYSSMHYLDDGWLYGIDINFTLSTDKDPAVQIYNPVERKSQQGIRWIKSKITGIYFSDKQNGYVAYNNGTSLPEILETQDGGKSWTTVPNSKGSRDVFQSRAGILFKVDLNGSIYSSDNHGKSWRLEKSVINIMDAIVSQSQKKS